jgi:D-lactate dehydrogenase (cytochrome)
VAPCTEGEVAYVLREASAVLPVGAQSSLTGGATPFGEQVVSLARMEGIGPFDGERVACEAGVALLTLQREVRSRGLYYPPVPTFQGAFVGGVVSTNAAGAATFKYGSTRDWVDGLTVVLASGEVLDLVRGECRAHTDGYFEVELGEGVRRVSVPRYTMPDVKKRSAGYFASPRMDLVDLFVGSEGTLGVITGATLRLVPDRPRGAALLLLPDLAAALEATRRLREAAEDPDRVDVASVEVMDRRSLELLREDGQDTAHGVALHAGVGAALLAELESAPGDDPFAGAERVSRILADLVAEECVLFAPPKDRGRIEELEGLREAVPLAVNHRIAALQRTAPGVHKVAADMVVPFERLGEAVAVYQEGFRRRGLDHALWGHVSDGNIHANVIPRSQEDVARGEEAILEFGAAIVALGGCPLSEHGVGRNPVKQELLRRLYGSSGVEDMRRVKAALDPLWKLSPGVIFPREPTGASR